MCIHIFALVRLFYVKVLLHQRCFIKKAILDYVSLMTMFVRTALEYTLGIQFNQPYTSSVLV